MMWQGWMFQFVAFDRNHHAQTPKAFQITALGHCRGDDGIFSLMSVPGVRGI